MVFKCQEDSFLKEFTSKVVSCENGSLELVVDGKKTKIDGYEVKLEDTILFPEGGGQPCDYGYLNETKVLQVRRQAGDAIHFVTSPLPVGEDVKQSVEWTRRFDHMQQHSGQHLLSAILERDYAYNTDSWWLGEDVSYIELDTPSMSDAEIAKTEEIVNELIRSALPVVVRVYKQGDPELAKASTRGLPEDHVGEVRVISIGNIDNNMCCGTHVTNLSQLQSIKILYVEKGKRKNKTMLYFLVGNRVLQRLNECLVREQKLTAILNNGPSKHVELVDKLQKNVKVMNKNLQTLLKDVAITEAGKVKAADPPLKYFCMFRKDAEQDFINTFIREVNSTSTLLFLTCGEEKGAGNMVLYGEENIVAELAPKICELLDGKGAGKGNRFQAKVSKMMNRTKCEKLIEKYFA